jgi:hypothetical protein
MEDIRIGRKKITTVRQVAVDNVVPTIIAAFSAARTHITFACATAGVRISPREVDGTLQGSFTIAGQAGPPLDFDIELHGDVVTKPWQGINFAFPIEILVIETFLEDK